MNPMFVRVRSKPCPKCGETKVVMMTKAEFENLRDHTDLIQNTLGRFGPDVRERFQSGYCPRCWDEAFKEEE